MSKYDYKEISRLIKEGHTDKEIGIRTGSTSNFVNRFRNSGVKVEDMERSPQKICHTYCCLESGLYGHEIKVLEGVKDVPYSARPVGWVLE